jgi:glycosyltransferase involved in cell wall biosynthesis
MNQKIILVGPGSEFIGGIAEFIEGMRNSPLKDDFDMILFDALAIKKRNMINDKTSFSLKEIQRSLRVFKHFYKCLKQHPGAHVHIHSSCFWGFYEKILMLVFSKICGRKTFIHLHGGDFIAFYENSILKALLRFLLSLSDKIISVSQDIKDIIKLPYKTVLIGNGIYIPEPEILCKEKFTKFTFLSVSVLEHRKRIDLILKAVIKLKSLGFTDFRFVFAGNGPAKDDLLTFIKDNHLDDVVDYRGIVRGYQKEELFFKSHVFISNSMAESFGISIAEAMAHGLGIISTSEGIAAFCLKENNGIVIPKNDAEALAQAMISYLNGKQNLSSQSSFNYKYIKDNYSWDIIANKIAQVYQGIDNFE